ncbi:MAG TPA: prepilin-type N-terminal cleavage/methylation domain-containing protein [Thermoanaerobaculia bacterium]|nr:prepilin-type N-terminal cleavage/methylation domain-containing protein [Thermoanaerobaculia bacterium]
MRDQRGFSIRSRGFSLIELLVALLILTLVITFSMAAFVERNRRLQQASEIVLAYQALANEAEYRRRIDYGALEVASREFVSDTRLLQPLAPFGTAVAVTQSRPGVKNVLMTIRWQNGQRSARLELVRVDTGGTNLW